MSLPARLITAFTELSHQEDDAFEIMECALLVSQILQPSGKIAPYRPILKKISLALKQEFEHQAQTLPPLDAQVKAVQKTLCHKFGFGTDEEAFDDLEHMNMFSLLDHKCGTAHSLSILFLHLMHACGWSAHALNFPGYCLLRIQQGRKRTIIDPFQGCIELNAADLRQFLKVIAGAEGELKPAYSEPLSAKTIALRHINAIKFHFLRCQQLLQALELSQTLIILEPTSAAFWRETGLLQARLNQNKNAINSLQTALRLTTDAQAIRHTQAIIDELEKSQ